MITVFLEMIYNEAYELWVETVPYEYSMPKLVEDCTLFEDFEFAVETIDVNFQQSNPSWNLQEGKKKVEVAVNPKGLAASASRHYASSKAEISIQNTCSVDKAA